jgi:hypothetical protein
VREWSNVAVDWSNRYDRLLDDYKKLRLQGAEPIPPVIVTPRQLQPIEPEDAELTALVAEKAGDDLRKRAIMLRQLKRDRLDGVSVEEIRRQIEQGVQSDGVMA